MPYSGTHTSLYKTIPSEAIPVLENAILKSRLRLYDAAEHVFNHELASYSNMPIVAIEHAETLLHRFKFFRILEVLDRISKDLPSMDEEDRDVHRLIVVFRGLVRIQTEGVYEPALEELIRLQRDWASKPVDEYTDIQVECIRKYRLACIFLGATSFVTDEMKFIPTPNLTALPPLHWQGFTDLRISLISRGLFMEAFRFSSSERNASTALENYQITCLLIQIARDHCAEVDNAEDEIPWRVAISSFKLDLAKIFARLDAKAEAEFWLSNLEKEIEDNISLINGSSGTLRASESLDMMTIELCRLKMVEKEKPTESRFQQLLILGEKMQAMSHIETEASHSLAINWAQKLYPTDEFETIRTDIQLRTQQHFENQGRVPMAMTNIAAILNPRAAILSEAAKSVEMLDEFERKHPHITLPPIKQLLLRMQNIMHYHAGYPRDLDVGSEANDLLSSRPTTYNLRRHVCNTEPNQQTLEFKDILDKSGVEEHAFHMIYNFFAQPEKIVLPKLLKTLVAEEALSGILTEQALLQLFGSGENNRSFSRDEVLDLGEKELLQNLVGTSECPLYAAEWAKRRPALRAWLLDESRPKFPIRQCLWVAIHNARKRSWALHFTIITGRGGFTKLPAPKLVKIACVAKAVKTLFPVLLEATCEYINAIEERLDLNEAGLGYASNHFEKESRLARSTLSRLNTNLFFYCVIPGEELSNNSLEFLNRADEIARDQVAHWRSVANTRFFAHDAIYLAIVAQLRMEHSIIKKAAAISRTVDETLELLEEVELLFGTTLYEIGLSHSLHFLDMKVRIGNGMGIWRIGNTAIRLLHLAIRMTRVEGGDCEQTISRHEKWLLQLWQWVQRVKARTLAQSMGLDNMVPDGMLVEMQISLNAEKASAERELAASVVQKGSDEETSLMKRLEAIRLEAACAPPLELLPEVRLFLKESNNAVPNLPIDAALRGGPIKPKSYNTETDRNIVLEEVFSLNRDLQTASALSKKIKQTDDTEIENKTKLQQELSEISNRIAMKPALHKLLTIADFLNREEALRNNIETEPDRYQQRVELQRLRKDMRREPVLERLFGLREGRPVSNQDLHKIAATRKGKVVFVDWLTITSSIDHIPRLYMLLWRNGDCKEIDLGTDHRVQCAAVKEFFQDKSLYLPDVEPTPLEYMNLDHLAPKTEKPTNKLRPVLNCFKLVKPLFDNPLVEPGDLLVLSPTEGFHNFPLHAIQDEGGKIGPLILQHPVMYVPSLSVLHKCFWGRHAANTGRKTGQNEMAKSLVLGGIESLKPVFQYGVKAVNRIGGILNSPDTTFIGANATLNNFRKNISSSDFIHIQLHTTYGDKKPALRSEHGHLSQHDEEDVTFVNSPLDQAILFNGADSKNELTARQITELQLSNGAHFNLMACASGRQGTYKVDSSIIDEEIITDEVMGLVPAFLFSGAGSVTSTLWPIMDEHGAVFSHFFFRELVGAKEKACKDRSLGHNELPWVDLAELHQKAVLEMRRIYKQPSAWAGFVLSGYWQFQI